MPSYDKEKLLRMMQERHVGFLAARDLLDRQSDLRKQIEQITQNIRRSAAAAGQQDFFEDLLLMPLNEGLALKRDQVETCRSVVPTRTGGIEREASTGISGQMWADLMQRRSHMERLGLESQRLQATMDERYAVLPKLKDAVIDWGFNNPDHEM